MAKDHTGYLRRISALASAYSFLPSAWQTALVAAASAVTGYLGFQQGGYFYAAIGAAFVFGAGMFGLFFTLLVVRQSGLFGKIAIRDIGISDFAADVQGNFLKEIKQLTMNCVIQNNSFRDIHFRVARANLSVMNQVNHDAPISDFVNILPSGQQQSISFATIPSIKLNKLDISRPASVASPVSGKVEVELLYGPNNESLLYSFTYEAVLSFGLSVVRPSKGKTQTQMKVMASIKRYSHKQVYMNKN